MVHSDDADARDQDGSPARHDGKSRDGPAARSQPAIGDALHWLDSHAGWPPGEARRRVRAALRELDEDNLHRLVHARDSVGQAGTAAALRAYYEAGGASPRSNEGLFALLEGIRRLRQLDSDRIARLPSIEVEL